MVRCDCAGLSVTDGRGERSLTGLGPRRGASRAEAVSESRKPGLQGSVSPGRRTGRGTALRRPDESLKRASGGEAGPALAQCRGPIALFPPHPQRAVTHRLGARR